MSRKPQRTPMRFWIVALPILCLESHLAKAGICTEIGQRKYAGTTETGEECSLSISVGYKPAPWTPNGGFDRCFYPMYVNVGPYSPQTQRRYNTYLLHGKYQYNEDFETSRPDNFQGKFTVTRHLMRFFPDTEEFVLIDESADFEKINRTTYARGQPRVVSETRCQLTRTH